MEGAGLGVGALGKGTGGPLLVGNGSWVERAASQAARRGDGDRLDGAPTAELLQVRGAPGRDSSAAGVPNKAGMC